MRVKIRNYIPVLIEQGRGIYEKNRLVWIILILVSKPLLKLLIHLHRIPIIIPDPFPSQYADKQITLYYLSVVLVFTDKFVVIKTYS